MPRLSIGRSVPVYMLTRGELELNSNSLLVTSDEAVGSPDVQRSNRDSAVITSVGLAAASLLIVTLAANFLHVLYDYLDKRRG